MCPSIKLQPDIVDKDWLSTTLSTPSRLRLVRKGKVMGMKNFPRVGDTQTFTFIGDVYPTKSGGNLDVLCALPSLVVQVRFFTYDAEELQYAPMVRPGLRLYRVSDLPRDPTRRGGGEFHRIRQEYVIALGSVRWTFEDIYGDTREVVLKPRDAVWIQPFTMHTYEVLDDECAMLVIANTLFDPKDPATHDTYSMEQFRALKRSLE